MTDQTSDGYPKYLQMNYLAISKNADMSSVTRLLAMRLIGQQYISLGDFFRDLSARDGEELYKLVSTFNNPDIKDQKAATEMIVLTEMLSRAEGVFATSHIEVARFVSMFAALIITHSLEKKGMVIVDWDNASFGSEYDNKSIARAVPRK